MEKKLDRFMFLVALWGILASGAYIFVSLHKTKTQIHNAKLEYSEQSELETMRIKIWRAYHEEQMDMLRQIYERMDGQGLRSVSCL